ncbi:Transcription initiation factor IIA subunit 1 [Cichlidogyrus casuarinus]|uniref:Transcription initiation factor IIA subunit 1 n=1 Tax=Cichlidogyrus casuarinus TaxID=1844966 RepID=A0ABD2QDW2_9PLAT
MTNVAKFYQEVIDNVIDGLNKDLEYEGHDVQFLEELKQLWEAKLSELNVTGPEHTSLSASQYHTLAHNAANRATFTHNYARQTQPHSLVVPQGSSLIARMQQPSSIAVPQPQTISALRPQTTISSIATPQTGQNVQLIVLPQMVLNQGQQLITTQSSAQSQIRSVLSSQFQNAQLDGNADDSDVGSDIELISEAPSSVRPPMSNMPNETPLVRVGLSNQRHGGGDSDDDDDDLVPATPLAGGQTPRYSNMMPPDSNQYINVGTPMTPFSMASPARRPEKRSSINESGVATPRTPRSSVKKRRFNDATSPGPSGYNYGSDSEFEYEYDDDHTGMTPRPSRKHDSSETRGVAGSNDVPLNLSKGTPRNGRHEVDDEGVPLKAGTPTKSKKRSEPKRTDESDEEEQAQVPVEEEEDEDPLNSGDDVSEEDTDEIFETRNVVVCQYDKITRARNKWRFHFKDGIMSIDGRDHLFQKAIGDAEW